MRMIQREQRTKEEIDTHNRSANENIAVVVE